MTKSKARKIYLWSTAVVTQLVERSYSNQKMGGSRLHMFVAPDDVNELVSVSDGQGGTLLSVHVCRGKAL